MRGWAPDRRSLERKLGKVRSRLVRAREELAVLDEQLLALDDDADDSRIRALVSDGPEAGHVHTDAQRHADATRRSRDALLASIAELELAQDDLLDRLVSTSR